MVCPRRIAAEDAAQRLVKRQPAPVELQLPLAHAVGGVGSLGGPAQHHDQLHLGDRARNKPWRGLVKVGWRLLKDDTTADGARLQRPPSPQRLGVLQPNLGALPLITAGASAHVVKKVHLASVRQHTRVCTKPRLQLARACLLHTNIDDGRQAVHAVGRLEAVTSAGLTNIGANEPEDLRRRRWKRARGSGRERHRPHRRHKFWPGVIVRTPGAN